MDNPHSEPTRKIVHIAVGGGALLLTVLTWWQAALVSAAATLVNAFVLPRTLPSLARAGTHGKPDAGMVLYPAAVLVLLLIFRERLHIVAVAWVILAAGDGFATLVGAHVRSAPLPWNPRKSVLGFAAFVVFGTAASLGIGAWMRANSSVVADWWWIAAPIAATIAAALVETVPMGVNDNISVSATAATVAFALSWINDSTWAAAWPGVAGRMPMAFGLNLIASAAGWLAGTVTIPGAVVGALIGIAVFAGLGWPGWLMLFAAFAASAISTRLGHTRKARAGIAEARGGRRGPGNAIANTSLAACLAVLSIGLAAREIAIAAFVAALVTAASDTVASEIGKVWGRTTWLVTSWRRVPAGTTGAVSLEGTAAGIVSAAALSGLALALGLVSLASVPAIVLAATVAAFVESVLGATLEARGVLDNDALNFLNTLVGALLAALFVIVARAGRP